jgi:predicted transcriptional regulator
MTDTTSTDNSLLQQQLGTKHQACESDNHREETQDKTEKLDEQEVDLPQKRKKYAVISDEQRKQLLYKVISQGTDIKEVAQELNLNISTAKGIIKTYMTEGRVNKKKTRNRSFLEMLNQPRPQAPFPTPIVNSTIQNSPVYIILPGQDQFKSHQQMLPGRPQTSQAGRQQILHPKPVNCSSVRSQFQGLPNNMFFNPMQQMQAFPSFHQLNLPFPNIMANEQQKPNSAMFQKALLEMMMRGRPSN